MAIAVIQDAAVDGSTSSFGVAFGSNVTAGNFIAVSGSNWGTAGHTITDTQSNTYNVGVTGANDGGSQITIRYAYNITGGSNTVTTGGSGDRSIVITEFSGVESASDPLDADTSTGSGSSGTAAAGSITPAAGDHLYIGAFGTHAGGGSTAGGSYTNIASEITSSSIAPNMMSWLESSGVQSATATFSSNDWWAASAAFILAPTDTLDQEGFQFRDDDGSETGASDRGAQDSNITEAKATNIRLRVLINSTGDPDAKSFQLEYKKSGDNDSEFRAV